MSDRAEYAQEHKYEGQLFTERPVIPDARAAKFFLRVAVTFGSTILLVNWLWVKGVKVLHLVGIYIIKALAGAFAFGHGFFGFRINGVLGLTSMCEHSNRRSTN